MAFAREALNALLRRGWGRTSEVEEFRRWRVSSTNREAQMMIRVRIVAMTESMLAVNRHVEPSELDGHTFC